MVLGYAKLFKVPLFLTAHFWIIYYVNTNIFFQEIQNNSSRFKSDYTIFHDAVISSTRKFVGLTKEPPMSLGLASLLTFNFEIEMIVVGLFNQALAIIAGYWAVHNYHTPLVQTIAAAIKPWAKFNPAKLQNDFGYLIVCLVCSWHIHYWWYVAQYLAKFTGRRETMKIDPWTTRKPKTFTERVYDEMSHLAHVAADETAHLAHMASDGAKFAYAASKKGASKIVEAGKHVVEDAQHAISDKAKHMKKK